MTPTTKEERVERGLQQALREGVIRDFAIELSFPPTPPRYVVDVPGIGEIDMTLARAEAFCIGVLAARRAIPKSPSLCEGCGQLLGFQSEACR